MGSNSPKPTLPPYGILGLMVVAVVLPLVVLFAMVNVGFSPPPAFVFVLVVVAPLMALRMTLSDRKG